MFKNILVPTDGTSLSNIAVGKAVEFAKLNPGCQIIAITVAEMMPFAAVEGVGVVDPAQYEKSMKDMAQKCVNKVADAAKAAGIPCKTITAQSSTPSDEILKAAKSNNCDLIFMASHGRKVQLTRSPHSRPCAIGARTGRTCSRNVWHPPAF